MYNDRDLVDKILNGNKAIFSVLIKKYEKLVWHIVAKMILDEDEIKDVCQEVFIKIYLNLEKFKFDSKLSTWIATITYRISLNYLKKVKKVSFSDINDQVIIDKVTSEEDPLKSMEKKDINSTVHHLLEQLPIQYRSVITMYHINEFSYQEIAEITGMPDGTVKNYLFRGRRILKDLLNKSKIFSLI